MDTTQTTTTATDSHDETIFPVLVHRDGEEGALQIDRRTGKVLGEASGYFVPDWAEGLLNASTASHLGFYRSRLGNSYEWPEAFNYADLDWIALNEDGDPTEITADPEHRADRLAAILGLETDIDKLDLTSAETDATVTEVLISMDTHRTPEEIAAFEQSQKEGFGDRLTGTR